MQLFADRPIGQRRQLGQRAPPVSASIDGPPPDPLDELEHLVAGLVADDVAEDAPESADVGAECFVLARGHEGER